MAKLFDGASRYIVFMQVVALLVGVCFTSPLSEKRPRLLRRSSPEAYGYPVPSLTWERDGTPLSNQSQSTIYEELVVENGLTFVQSILEVCSLEEDDTAQYNCSASNNISFTSASFNLTVKHIPTSIVIISKSALITAGQPGLFVCVAYGYPVPSLTWERDGTPLSNQSRSIIYEELVVENELTFIQSILVLCSLEQDDAAQYDCSASNNISFASASFNLTVKHIPTSIVIISKSARITAGHTGMFVCVAYGYPVPSLTWERDGTPFSNQSRSTIYEKLVVENGLTFVQSILEICSLEQDDTAQYNCSASNSISFASASFNLTVKHIPTSIVIISKSALITAGQTGMFMCVAYGYPVPSLTWERDGTPLINQSRSIIYEELVVENELTFIQSILVLCSLEQDDTAQYNCSASNNISFASASFNLTVKHIPTSIVIISKSALITAGQTGMFVCVANGYPLPSLTWERNGTPLSNQSRSTIYEELVVKNGLTFVQSILEVCSLEQDDTAQYNCSASNNISSANASFNLIVNRRCQPGTIQLVATQSEGLGLVQICLDRSWIDVYGGSWSNVDAAVACRQLGYSFYGAHAYTATPEATITVPLLSINVSCTGSETMLTSCAYDCIVGDCTRTVGDCTRTQPAAGVMCNTTLIDCGAPNAPQNGYLESYTRTTESSEVFYSCDPDHLPEGRMRGVCTDNGWSPNPADLNCTQISPSTAANEYYVGFFKNYCGEGNMTLFITTTVRDPVPFTVNSSTGQIYTGTANDSVARSVILPSSFAVIDNDERDKGVQIHATDAITVHGMNDASGSADGFVALPYYDYQEQNYIYYAVSAYFNGTSHRSISQVLLVGCEESTELTITPTQMIQIPPDSVMGGNLPFNVTSGESHTITLNRLQTFFFYSTLDFTGTKVVSNKLISFFSGRECADVPVGVDGCDNLVEQLPPTLTWGKQFYVVSFLNRITGEQYKLITSTATTEVECYCYTSGASVSQTFMTTLSGAGSSYKFNISQNMFCSVLASSPVLLVQFAIGGSHSSEYGESFMMMIPPVEQYSNNYTFVTQPGFQNAITVIVDSQFLSSAEVVLNGILESVTSATWSEIYCSTQTVCAYGTRIRTVNVGRNFISHRDPTIKVGTFVYGFRQNRSYGYPAGMQLAKIPVGAPETSSSIDAGAVAGGSIAGVIAMLLPVIACLMYYRRRKMKSLVRHKRGINRPTHTYVRDVNVEMRQFDEHRVREKLNEEATRYVQKFPEEMVFHTGNLHLLEMVGQGEFGIVYRARVTRPTIRKTDCEIVAVKTVKGFLDPSDIADLLKECLKMKAFVHPHVMGILGICLDGRAPYIVMPFMVNGNLHTYLRKHRMKLLISEDEDIDLICKTQKRMLDMCLQIAKGMEYLTGHNVVHRDLAARNCMLDQNYVIKVADFGLSEKTYTKDYFRQEQTTGVKLPMKWMAYESLTDGIFSEKTDVWSFGVTCWEIFSTAKTPYPGIHPTTLIAQLETGERLPKPNNAACCDSTYEVMRSCWDADPEQRPTFSQLVTTITSVLDPLADYLDVTTFVTEEQATNEMEKGKCGKEASQEGDQTTETHILTRDVPKNDGAEECAK